MERGCSCCHANFQPFPRIKYLGRRGGGEWEAAGAWKVMNTNRCCKQMLDCSRHTYLIILGAENSWWMVHEKRRSSPSERPYPSVQQPRARKALSRQLRGTERAPSQLSVHPPHSREQGASRGAPYLPVAVREARAVNVL